MTEETKLAVFDFEVAVVATLDAKYKDVTIKNPTDYKMVMAGIAEYRGYRLEIDDAHKVGKKKAKEEADSWDSEKRRLKALLEPGEEHLKAVRQVYDDEKEAIRLEKKRVEDERIQEIQDRLNAIHKYAQGLGSLTAKELTLRLMDVHGIAVDKEDFQELETQATQAKKDAYNDISSALSTKRQQDKDDAARVAQAELLEKTRLEQEDAQAKIDEGKAALQAEKDKLEADKKAEADRKEREEFERLAKIKAIEEATARVEAEKAERERVAKAKEEEEKRAQAMKPDKEKLIEMADNVRFNIAIPKVDSPEAKKIIQDFKDEIDELAEDVRDKAEAL